MAEQKSVRFVDLVAKQMFAGKVIAGIRFVSTGMVELRSRSQRQDCPFCKGAMTLVPHPDNWDEVQQGMEPDYSSGSAGCEACSFEQYKGDLSIPVVWLQANNVVVDTAEH